MEVISSTHEVSSTTPQPMLPPCRVCGEKASGFHYGVNTCEACKGFFRRSLHRKHEYQCSGNNNCEIGPGRRNSCAKCRYEKCINVGMSKQAIKTGRYTHEKRTRDIQEIKSLQKHQLEDPNLKTSPGPFHAVGEEVRGGMDRAWQLEQMVDRIVQVHLQQTPLTPEFYQQLPIRQAKFLERKRLEEETFGQMKPIPREEYREFYEKTGIDVDGRRELIVSMIPYLEEGIRRFICLAKSVPGFKELPVDDQIGLLKTNKMECGLIIKYKLYNPELGVCSSPDGIHVRVVDCAKLEHYPTIEALSRKAAFLQKINFTDEENMAFFAVTLLFADRYPLERPAQVEHYQLVMVEALQHLLKKNHPEDPLLFARLMVFLMDLRSLTELHAKNIEKVHLEFNDIQFPPLLYEML